MVSSGAEVAPCDCNCPKYLNMDPPCGRSQFNGRNFMGVPFVKKSALFLHKTSQNRNTCFWGRRITSKVALYWCDEETLWAINHDSTQVALRSKRYGASNQHQLRDEQILRHDRLAGGYRCILPAACAGSWGFGCLCPVDFFVFWGRKMKNIKNWQTWSNSNDSGRFLFFAEWKFEFSDQRGVSRCVDTWRSLWPSLLLNYCFQQSGNNLKISWNHSLPAAVQNQQIRLRRFGFAHGCHSTPKKWPRQVLVVDGNFELFSRAWCVAEVAEAYMMGSLIEGSRLRLVRVQNCGLRSSWCKISSWYKISGRPLVDPTTRIAGFPVFRNLCSID